MGSEICIRDSLRQLRPHPQEGGLAIRGAPIEERQQNPQVPYGQRSIYHCGQTRWKQNEADQVSRRCQDRRWRWQGWRPRRQDRRRRCQGQEWRCPQDLHQRRAKRPLYHLGGIRDLKTIDLSITIDPPSGIDLLFYLDLVMKIELAAARCRRGNTQNSRRTL